MIKKRRWWGYLECMTQEVGEKSARNIWSRDEEGIGLFSPADYFQHQVNRFPKLSKDFLFPISWEEMLSVSEQRGFEFFILFLIHQHYWTVAINYQFRRLMASLKKSNLNEFLASSSIFLGSTPCRGWRRETQIYCDLDINESARPSLIIKSTFINVHIIILMTNPHRGDSMHYGNILG